LDNAIEACLKIPESEKRLIKVSAYSQHQFVIVRVENYWPHPVDFVDGLPQSTKPDRAKHGFGTSNMRKIVHRYGGTLKIDVADDWYRLSALLPKPQKRGPK
ncbi:MAG TPA: ATP-binding protein, partial [Actinomycetales bacterium]|nr:ATP-binding protein [Actinomycetales bacterium]